MSILCLDHPLLNRFENNFERIFFFKSHFILHIAYLIFYMCTIWETIRIAWLTSQLLIFLITFFFSIPGKYSSPSPSGSGSERNSPILPPDEPEMDAKSLLNNINSKGQNKFLFYNIFFEWNSMTLGRSYDVVPMLRTLYRRRNNVVCVQGMCGFTHKCFFFLYINLNRTTVHFFSETS